MSDADPGSELLRLRALVDDLDAVVWETEASSGRFTFVSERAGDLLGHPPSRFLEDPDFWVDHVYPDDLDAAVDGLVAAYEEGRAHDIEYRFIRPDGSAVWIRDIGHPVAGPDGGPVAVRGLMVDVSNRELPDERHAEAERLERALEAEREQAAELRALDETKNTFLAAVSHDLRTPLAAILGLAVTLEERALDTVETKELASRIAANARKLDRIVSDLLDLDRLSRGIVAPDLRRVDLGELVDRVVGESEIVAGRDLVVETANAVVAIDAAMVERIVENLLSNAVRYTPTGSRIWVRVRPGAGGALLAVDDEGPGVAPEHRQEIFEPFRQAGASERSPGVGIGLTLVERFAELHGGSAWVEDGEQGGASFRVWFPSRPSNVRAR